MKKHIYFFDNIPNIVVDLFLNEKLKLNRKVRNRIKKIKSKKKLFFDSNNGKCSIAIILYKKKITPLKHIFFISSIKKIIDNFFERKNYDINYQKKKELPRKMLLN